MVIAFQVARRSSQREAISSTFVDVVVAVASSALRSRWRRLRRRLGAGAFKPSGNDQFGGHVVRLMTLAAERIDLLALDDDVGRGGPDVLVVGMSGAGAVAVDATGVGLQVGLGQLFPHERHVANVAARIGPERIELMSLGIFCVIHFMGTAGIASWRKRTSQYEPLEHQGPPHTVFHSCNQAYSGVRWAWKFSVHWRSA